MSTEQLINQAKRKFPRGTIFITPVSGLRDESSGYFEEQAGGIFNSKGKGGQVYDAETKTWATKIKI